MSVIIVSFILFASCFSAHLLLVTSVLLIYLTCIVIIIKMILYDLSGCRTVPDWLTLVQQAILLRNCLARFYILIRDGSHRVYYR